jgi:SAM-dependent methyltransferase
VRDRLCVGVDAASGRVGVRHRQLRGQLATARRLSDLHGLDDIEWVHGNAETVAQLDGSFDFAISEYGAAIWCEPMAWVGEAHRLLRPGGELVFLGNHPLAMVCSPIDGSAPVTERLERAYFDLRRLDWRDAIDEPGSIEFNLPISSWIRLFHDIGFDVIDYIEVRAPESATGIHGAVTAEWAKRFPSEQVWRSQIGRSSRLGSPSVGVRGPISMKPWRTGGTSWPC